MNLQRLLVLREGQRNVIQSLLKEFEANREDGDALVLKVLMTYIDEMLPTLKEYDTNIRDQISTDAIKAEVIETGNYNMHLLIKIRRNKALYDTAVADHGKIEMSSPQLPVRPCQHEDLSQDIKGTDESDYRQQRTPGKHLHSSCKSPTPSCSIFNDVQDRKSLTLSSSITKNRIETTERSQCIESSENSDMCVDAGSTLQLPIRTPTLSLKRYAVDDTITEGNDTADDAGDGEMSDNDDDGNSLDSHCARGKSVHWKNKQSTPKKNKKKVGKTRKEELEKAEVSECSPGSITNLLTTEHPPDGRTDMMLRKQPYFPQIGDEFDNFRPDNELYVMAVKRHRTYSIDPNKDQTLHTYHGGLGADASDRRRGTDQRRFDDRLPRTNGVVDSLVTGPDRKLRTAVIRTRSGHKTPTTVKLDLSVRGNKW